jgi:hypothetical protein
MPNHILRGLLYVFLLTSFHCRAGVLFDDVANPNVSNGRIVGTPSDAFQIATDFQIEDLSGRGLGVVTGLNFWTLDYVSLAVFDDTVDYFIWSDDGTGNAPDFGNVVNSGNADIIDRTTVPYNYPGQPAGTWTQTKWTTALDDVVLYSDIKYWLGLSFGSSKFLFWQFTDQTYGFPGSEVRTLPNGPWSASTNEVAFELTGVPVPGTSLLVGLMVPALIYIRRRARF